MTIDFHLWRQNAAGGPRRFRARLAAFNQGNFAHAAPRQLASDCQSNYTATDDDDFGGCTRFGWFVHRHDLEWWGVGYRAKSYAGLVLILSILVMQRLQ